MLAWIAVGGFTVQIHGLIVLALMLRESQRLTRAVAGLVYQDGERTRTALAPRGPGARFGGGTSIGEHSWGAQASNASTRKLAGRIADPRPARLRALH